MANAIDSFTKLILLVILAPWLLLAYFYFYFKDNRVHDCVGMSSWPDKSKDGFIEQDWVSNMLIGDGF